MLISCFFRSLERRRTYVSPWYHRDLMTEFMGLINGVYDARSEGFTPGGISLHNQVLPHGPGASVLQHASTVDLKPSKLAGALGFMFETSFRNG